MNDIAPTRFKWVGTRPIRPDGVPKVTGRAMYGADFATAGTLYGKVLRSPHAHARIRSIDTSKAEALPGVKAVVTAKDFPDQKFEYQGPERVQQNFWHMTRNVMAREKALYEGHAVAAVAAISKSVAEEAASLIAIDYEVLPHVIDVDDAMKPDAPLLFEDQITRGIEPAPTTPSNIAKRVEFKIGDLDAGFAEADVVVDAGQNRRQERRHDHGRRRRVQIPGRRLSRLAGDERLHVRLRTLQHPQSAHDRLRCRVQPAEIGRIPGAGLADLGFRCGKR